MEEPEKETDPNFEAFFADAPYLLQEEERILKSILAEMDSDGDGRITEEEFVSACLRHSTFSDLLTGQIIKMFWTNNIGHHHSQHLSSLITIELTENSNIFS